jgi:heme exporter protein A
MAAMSMSAAFPPTQLRVRGLAVRRGERLLFETLDFDVAPGGVLLARGANGAGKSTLLLALAGVVRPDAGSITLTGAGGETIPAREMTHLITYQHGIKGRLTVRENLRFWRQMHGPGGVSVDDALEVVGIGGLGVLEAGYLSSGQTRRLSLARLLVSRRPFWLLDEPSATLDRDGEALLGRLIDTHRREGGLAVIATHHDLPLAETRDVATITLGGAA